MMLRIAAGIALFLFVIYVTHVAATIYYDRRLVESECPCGCGADCRCAADCQCRVAGHCPRVARRHSRGVARGCPCGCGADCCCAADCRCRVAGHCPSR